MNNNNNNTVACLRSIAVGLPKTIRENSWFKQNHPEVHATMANRALAKTFDTKTATKTTTSARFDGAMKPYLADPFRGTKQRRILDEGVDQIELEKQAALSAIKAAKLEVKDIDAILVASFPPVHPVIGDGVYLARALGSKVAAVNVETACSGGLAALQMASAMVTAGQAENVLVVVSCIYSRAVDWTDTLSWFLSDGVGAYVVSRAKAQEERFVSFHAVNTADSCGAFEYRLETVDGAPKMVIRSNADASRALRDITPDAIRDACGGALAKKGLTVKDVDFFITNTPIAWFAEMFAEILEIPRSKTMSTYEEFANMGPALNAVNLHRAIQRGLVKRGDRVLLFSIGSVSSSTACVLELGDVVAGELVEL